VRHLTPGTSYTLTVEATDRSGNLATSNTVSQTTEPSSDVDPPSAPGNLRRVREPGDCEVVLAWDQSTDNVDAQIALEDEFYVNGVFADPPSGRHRADLWLPRPRPQHLRHPGHGPHGQHVSAEQRPDSRRQRVSVIDG
jgi:hypothetical protein